MAATIGLSTAVGVAASHLLPPWSAFSDAFPGGSVDGVSWIAVLLEIASAPVLGITAVQVLRTERRARRHLAGSQSAADDMVQETYRGSTARTRV